MADMVVGYSAVVYAFCGVSNCKDIWRELAMEERRNIIKLLHWRWRISLPLGKYLLQLVAALLCFFIALKGTQCSWSSTSSSCISKQIPNLDSTVQWFFLNIYLAPWAMNEETDRKLQMNRLSLRNNRLRFKTSGKFIDHLRGSQRIYLESV